MTDVFSKAKRSEVMSRIRSRGNRDTELALAQVLRAHGLTGWRRHLEIRGREVAQRRPRFVQGRNFGIATLNASRTAQRSVPTKDRAALPCGQQTRAAQQRRPTFRVRPDFVFRQARLAIFVDGCFWHGCPKHATQPKNNRAFWQRKLAGNRARDRAVNRALRRAGWRVLRIWEHETAWLKAKGRMKNAGGRAARLARRIAGVIKSG